MVRHRIQRRRRRVGAVRGAIMKRSLLRRLAQGTIGALLFAQLAIAAHACPTLSPATAGARSAQASHSGHGPGCSAVAATTEPSLANLCAEHCKSGQQSAQASTISVPAALLNVRYSMPQLPCMAVPARAAAASMSALVAGEPPHAILHCVRRT